MDFEHFIDDVVFCVKDYAVCKHVVTAISFDKDKILYTCDNSIAFQEKDLYSDYELCAKDLYEKLKVKLDALSSNRSEALAS